MKSLQAGTMPVSERVAQLARTLADESPGSLYVLTGIVFRAGDHSLAADLILLTPAGVFIGQEGRGRARPADSPELVAQGLAERLRQQSALARALPLYAFWIGDSPRPTENGGLVPSLYNAEAVRRYLERAAESGPTTRHEVAGVAEQIRRLDYGPQPPGRTARGPLRAALHGLARLPARFDELLQEQVRRPFFLRRSGPILPGDVTPRLEQALLSREYSLESPGFTRVVPNEFVVELNPDNYQRNYQPIADEVRDGWTAHLLDVLNTTNRRWGRKAYRFAGPVQIRLRPAAELGMGEVRVQAAVTPHANPETPGITPCLVEPDTNQRWPLSKRVLILGRSAPSDIQFSRPAVQQARLVSSRHAHIVREETVSGERYTLYDGAPGGPPSTNGTFVNGQRVGAAGRPLQDGDAITLAALDPERPRADTPGVVTLFFHRECSKAAS